MTHNQQTLSGADYLCLIQHYVDALNSEKGMIYVQDAWTALCASQA